MGEAFRAVTLAAIILLVSACSSAGEDVTARRFPSEFDPIGQHAAPRRPFFPTELPDGSEFSPRQLRAATFSSAAQSLFMPEGSTPAKGPAIVVGYVLDEEAGPDGCSPARRAYNWDDPPTVRKWGEGRPAVHIAGPDSVTSNDAYVFGRGVPDRSLRRVARSVRWSTVDATPPRIDLPRGWRLRATSGLAPFEAPFRASVGVVPPDSPGVGIGQEDTNVAGRYVAELWQSVMHDQHCSGETQRLLVRGNTVIRLTAKDTSAGRRAMAKVARSLRRVSRVEFCGDTPPGPGEPNGTCDPTLAG